MQQLSHVIQRPHIWRQNVPYCRLNEVPRWRTDYRHKKKDMLPVTKHVVWHVYVLRPHIYMVRFYFFTFYYTYTCQTTCFVTGSMILYRITPQSGIDHDLVSVVKILLKAFCSISVSDDVEACCCNNNLRFNLYRFAYSALFCFLDNSIRAT
jgi:hypothetical protein